MQLCLVNYFPLLPREQPGCLAMLLPSLPFPLVLWPTLSPVHTGAELASPSHPWAFPRGVKASHLGRPLTERVWATTAKGNSTQPCSPLSLLHQQPHAGGASCCGSCRVHHRQPWEQRLSQSPLEEGILPSVPSHRALPPKIWDAAQLLAQLSRGFEDYCSGSRLLNPTSEPLILWGI